MARDHLSLIEICLQGSIRAVTAGLGAIHNSDVRTRTGRDACRHWERQTKDVSVFVNIAVRQKEQELLPRSAESNTVVRPPSVFIFGNTSLFVVS